MMRHNVSNWIAWLGALLVTISVASPAFAQTTDKRAVVPTTGHSKAKYTPRKPRLWRTGPMPWPSTPPPGVPRR